MPPDTTKSGSSKRQPRKLTEEELKEIEEKRSKGELSCAECRRLKLRCDKKIPCGSCVRRGCESICPLGVLSAGQGTRFILADTDRLHAKISDMSQRIRQLEDGLAILQASVSSEKHPLLEDDLLRIKFGSEALNRQLEQNDPADTTNALDAFGTLTLNSEGEMKYFGRSAGSETLLAAGEDWGAELDLTDKEGPIDSSLPATLNKLANYFPFGAARSMLSIDLDSCRTAIESFLPPQERAVQLCTFYMDYAALLFRPIKRDELLNETLPSVYAFAEFRRACNAHTKSGTDNGEDFGPHPFDTSPRTESQTLSDIAEAACRARRDGGTPHKLAVLFFIMAIGATFDFNLPVNPDEAELYFNLGRAALNLRSSFDLPQISTIRAIGLMAIYCNLGGKNQTKDQAWCLMGLAVKLAQSIGLHRDSSRWRFSSKMVQRGRNLWWELVAADCSNSMALGRPPSVHPSFSDCEFPTDEEATLNDAGEPQAGLWRTKHAFVREIWTPLAQTTLIAKSPSYSTILDLDKKVREFIFPDTYKPYIRKEDTTKEVFHDAARAFADHYLSHHRPVVMQYLHRSFFAQALLDHSTNPLLSPFAPSFLTAYRTASILIKGTAHLYERAPEIAIRGWVTLSHVFSAAVVVGTVVTRSPNSSFASSALFDLGLAISLFEKMAFHSYRARTVMVVLRKLNERAIRSYTQFTTAALSSHIETPPPASVNSEFNALLAASKDTDEEDIEDGLSIFGGQRRVLARRIKSKSGSATNTPSPPSVAPSSSTGSDTPSSLRIASPSNPMGLDMTITQEWSNPNPPIANPTSMGDVHPSLTTYLNAQHQPDFTQEYMSSLPNLAGPFFESFTAPSIFSPPLTNTSSQSISATTAHGNAYQTNNFYSSLPGSNAGLQPELMPTFQVGMNKKPSWNSASTSPLPQPNAMGTGDDSDWPQSLLGTSPIGPTIHQPHPSGLRSSQDPTQPLHPSHPSTQTVLPAVGTGGMPGDPSINFNFNTNAGAIELGLMSESGMDTRWTSFMKELGIMDSNMGPNNSSGPS